MSGVDDRLELAVDAAGLGTWDWEVASNKIAWNRHACEMFGISLSESTGTFDEFVSFVHPDDVDALADELARAVTEGSVFDHEFRVRCADGSVRWLHGRGQPVFDDRGEAVRFSGVMIDRTELRSTDERMRELLETMGDGFFAFDSQWRVLYMNQRAEALMARSRHDLIGRTLQEIFPQSVWGEEDSPFLTAYREALESGKTSTCEAFYPPSNRYYEVRIHPAPDAISVYFTDVTNRRLADEARHKAEDELRYRVAFLGALFDAALDGIYAVSPDRRIIAFNSRLEEVLGIPEGTIHVGDSAPEVLGSVIDSVVDPDKLISDVDWGHANPTDAQRVSFQLHDGRSIEAYNAPILGDDGEHHGRVWYLRDDTERRVAETERTELLSRLRAAQRSQSFLLDASYVLAGASDFGETLERLAAVAVPELGDLCLIDIQDDEQGIVRMAARHADPARKELVERLEKLYPPDPAGRHPSVEAMRTGRSRWSAHMTDRFLRATCRDERHFELVKELGFTSYMTVPLVASGKVLGSLTLISAGSGRRFGPSDLSLAEDLAAQVAQVVEKAKRYEIEHRIAHSLQSSLLPVSLPVIPGMNVAVRYLAGTTGAEVGGDFYDVVGLPSGAVGLMVGDVAGHDTVAAAIMGQVRSASRALAYQVHRPEDLVDRLRDSWDLLGIDRIVTAAFARLDVGTGSISVASAGHPAPLLVARGQASPIPFGPSSPLGAPAVVGSPWRGRLERGSAMLFYTDGIVENRHTDIGAGIARLAEVAARAWLAREDTEYLCDRVLETMAARGERSDDVALLAVTRP